METLSAAVIEDDEKHYIEIGTEDDSIRIPLSEDKPKAVKSAFNQLIALVWEGEFQIELEVGGDLFSQVATEYIAQLNRELLEVRSEMEDHGLLEE